MIERIKNWLGISRTFGAVRSPKWKEVRKEHLRKFPLCEVCRSPKKIEAHHIKSFSEHPELELSPTNILSLCESKKYGITCHQFVGHLGDYRLINPASADDARMWREKMLKARKI